ncbi:MAG: glycine cleavage system protein GcvH [Acidobacteria bacterium]|nr:MAG: glycine cleavage system protein GcvH [Acidobacteriota bacterium]
MQYPDNLKYADSHEWASLESDTAVRMGISDFAQDALGDVVYVELPDVGADVQAGTPCSEVESTKSVSDVNAPVTGTITAVNAALEERPELVNSDPYGEGWFAVIEPSDTSELESLLSAAEYQASVE